MRPYYRAAARGGFLTAVKRLVLLREPLEDETVEAVGAALVAPAEVPDTARAVRDAPGIARKPGVLVARRALRRATRRGAKAAEVEAIARRVGAPVLVDAVDVDALALPRHRVAAARAKEPPAFSRVVGSARR